MTANPLTVKQKSFKDLIEKAQEPLTKALPKHLDPDRLVKFVLTAAMRQPLLYDCTQESILRSLMTCAELGLEPGDVRGQVYLIPYWNSRQKRYECQAIPGYRGLMSLARRSMNVKGFSAHVVHANDTFEVSFGLNEDLVHHPNLEDPGEALGVYAVAHLADGTKQFEVMTRCQVEEIKARSKSRDQQGRLTGPWVTDEDEMWRKTAIRRLCKYLELSPEMARAFEADDEAEVISSPERGVVDVEGLLNPSNRPTHPAVDLDTLRSAPIETTAVPVREASVLPPKILRLILALNPFGITRGMLEDLIGVPAEGWSPGVLTALQTCLTRLEQGAAPEQVLREIAAAGSGPQIHPTEAAA